MDVSRLAEDTRGAARRGRVPKRLALARYLLRNGSITAAEAKDHIGIRRHFDRELRALEEEGLRVEPLPVGARSRHGRHVRVLRYYLRRVPKRLLDEVDAALGR